MVLSDVDVVAVARQILGQANIQNQASIIGDGAEQNSPLIVQVIALDTARDITNPLILDFPFQSVTVQTATDQNTNVLISFNTRTTEGTANGLTLKNNSVCNFPYSVARAYLWWAAQAGKTVTLAFLRTGNFTTGNNITSISGGVVVQEGGTITTRTLASLPAISSTAGILCPADATRICEYITNQDGFNYYLGDASVTKPGGLNPGITMTPGSIYILRNTGALYACTDASTITNVSRVRYST